VESGKWKWKMEVENGSGKLKVGKVIIYLNCLQ
jgi:hypothetical protein